MKAIALALGGGGTRGFTHIGVIQCLERAGFSIQAIAGTSAGGLVGALYAAGYSPDQMANIIRNVDQSSLFKRDSHEGPALLGLRGITETLLPLLDSITFEQLRIPFACTAVDVITAQEYILDQGAVLDAVLATIAVPGIFPPREYGEALLVDGGILDPVPVSVARWLAPTLPVIAVCLSAPPEKWKHLPDLSIPPINPLATPLLRTFQHLRIGKAFHIFLKSMDTTARMLAELRLQIDRPDVLIRPDVEHSGFLDRVNPDELIQIGDATTTAAIPAIERCVSPQHLIMRRIKHKLGMERQNQPGVNKFIGKRK